MSKCVYSISTNKCGSDVLPAEHFQILSQVNILYFFYAMILLHFWEKKILLVIFVINAL